MRVLLIEDDEIDANVAKRELGAACDIDWCQSLREAHRRLNEGQHYDMIVTDMWMPGSAPEEVVPMLRKAAPGTMVVVSSGKMNGQDERQRLLNQGADALHTKANGSTLLRAVLQHSAEMHRSMQHRHDAVLTQAETAAREAARLAAKEAVEQLSKELGMEDAEDVRLAIRHARTWELLRTRFLMTVVGTMATGMISALLVGLYHLLRKD